MNSSHERSDVELVKLAKSEDFGAFEELVSRHSGRIYSLLYRLLRNREDAEDLLQQTFLSAFENLVRFREEASFKTWITRIATNFALMKFRKEGKIQMVSLDDPLSYTEEGVPYGGGPGMVLMPGPVCQAIRSVKRQDSHIIYLSPQGKLFDAQIAARLARSSHLILVCGHYEGLDERAIDQEIDEEISIGDYVLTNGCLASIVVLDATVRFIPGVLGHEEATKYESFQQGILEGPSYTRPDVFEGLEVPEVLKSGHHADIEKWRIQKGLEKTQRVRPDLLQINEEET